MQEFGSELGVDRNAYCTGAECEAHTPGCSTSIMRETNDVHKRVVTLLSKSHTVVRYSTHHKLLL